MKIFAKCEKCGKNGFFIRTRQYSVSKVSARPITTTNEMCGRCAKNLTKIIKRI